MGIVASNLRIFAPEIWSQFVKVYFREKLFAAKFFMDFSSDLKGGGDIITIPNLSEGPSPISLTTTTGALTDFVVSETRTQMTIDQWKGMSKYFSDFELGRIASHYNLQEMELRDNIAFKLAQVLDSALIGQSGQAQNIQLHTGTSAVNVNNTAIQEAIRIANTYSIDPAGMAFFLHPNAYHPMRLLLEIIRSKSRKLRGKLTESIRSQAMAIKKAIEGSTTIIGTPWNLGDGIV